MQKTNISHENVYKALIALQSELKPLAKKAKGHHGAYASLDQVMEYLRPLCEKHGLAIIQTPQGGSTGQCTINTIIVHAESGEQLESSITIPMQRQNDPQAYGAALSYGRRYSLLCVFGLVTEDDDASSSSYSLEKVLRELGAAGDLNELIQVKNRHYEDGLLKDALWKRVHDLVYREKDAKLKQSME